MSLAPRPAAPLPLARRAAPAARPRSSAPASPLRRFAALGALLAVAHLAGCGDASSESDAEGAAGEASAGKAGAASGASGKGGAGASSSAGSGPGGAAGQGGAAGGAGTSGEAGQSGAAGEAGASGASAAAGASGDSGAGGAGPGGQGGSSGGGSSQAGSGGESAGGQGGAGSGASGGSAGSAPVFLPSYSLKAQFPEGGTYDPLAHAFYVGSLGDGSVHRIDAATGSESVLFTETAEGTWWTLGMDVDVSRRKLWVCAMDDRSPDPRAGYIWIFDLETGKRLATHDLSVAAADATCTDVALTKDGRGYVGDREAGNVYLVDPDKGATLFATDPDLKSSFVGQNSMVVLPDESALLSLIYLPSRLMRVDLNNKAVTKVDISGTFYDLSPLAGADGMTYANGSAYVAFTSKLVRVTPSLGDWSAASAKAVDVPGGMTDVVSTPGGLYLLNGQSVTFALGTSPDPFALVRFVGDL